MNEPDLFDALRQRGFDATDPEIRSAVRVMNAHLDAVREREGTHAARSCMRAMQAALDWQLAHPDVDDMSTFEADMDEGD